MATLFWRGQKLIQLFSYLENPYNMASFLWPVGDQGSTCVSYIFFSLEGHEIVLIVVGNKLTQLTWYSWIVHKNDHWTYWKLKTCFICFNSAKLQGTIIMKDDNVCNELSQDLSSFNLDRKDDGLMKEQRIILQPKTVLERHLVDTSVRYYYKS